LSHHNTAHEDLNGPDALKRDLAFAGCLIKTQGSAELVLRYSIGVVDLVAENDEGGISELFHRKLIALLIPEKKNL
jgi:hypothetical protein